VDLDLEVKLAIYAHFAALARMVIA